MKINRLLATAMTAAALWTALPARAQQSNLTRESVLAMSIEQLSDLPMEDLIRAAELLDVQSVDELFSLLMNKNVSSASKREEDSFRSPLSTTVITKDEMRTFGVTSIEEALRLVPGVIVRERANGMYDIHLRGLDNIPCDNLLLYSENTNTLLMIDGRPVFNYAQGATLWESLPIGIEDLERIEVVRGAAGALYGSNAVTGVVNLITDKPMDTSPTVQGSANIGNQNTFMGDVALRHSFGPHVQAGLSVNMQRRNRNTSEFYFIPLRNVYNTQTGEQDCMAEGGWVTLSELEALRNYQDGTEYLLYKPEATVAGMYDEPQLARRSTGINGYLHLQPAVRTDISLTGGYQNSFGMTTPVGDEYCSLIGRLSKTGYVNATATIGKASLQANWFGGVQDFYYGTAGYKVTNRQFNGVAAYDFGIGSLTLRPEVSYQWYAFDDSDYPTYYDYGSGPERLAGFLNGKVDMQTFAASLRADWLISDQLRAIAAVRGEKLEIPDKWKASWQLAFTYAPTSANLLRLVAARANRSSMLVNSSSNYSSRRTGMSAPDYIRFLGNEDADVMYADNYEAGYRWRPTDNIIVDAEAFYNISKDHGALMADHSEITFDADQVRGTLEGTAAGFTQNLEAYMRYRNLPFEVKQRGLTVGIDWIVSNKLILKANASLQKTTIDNYYLYYQNGIYGYQLTQAGAAAGAGATALITEYTGAVMSGMAAEFLQPLARPTSDGQGYYYDLSGYGFSYDEAGNKYYTADGTQLQFSETRDDFEHRNTPRIYGMVGLIYKPVKCLCVSSYAYYYGEQFNRNCYCIGASDESGTNYTSTPVRISPKFITNLKVGYRPTDEFEISFNARNLFDDAGREFVYSDKIGGIYSIGANFCF